MENIFKVKARSFKVKYRKFARFAWHFVKINLQIWQYFQGQVKVIQDQIA